jgi:hypothetical protein
MAAKLQLFFQKNYRFFVLFAFFKANPKHFMKVYGINEKSKDLNNTANKIIRGYSLGHKIGYYEKEEPLSNSNIDIKFKNFRENS